MHHQSRLRHIAGLLGAFEFLLVRGQDGLVHITAALGIDGVRHVRVQLDAHIVGAAVAVFVELLAALVAIASPQVVFGHTRGAVIHELARGHRDEQAVRAVDDLDVANHKAAIQGDGAKAAEAVFAGRGEFYADVCDLHGNLRK